MQKHGTSQTVGDRRADHVLVDGDLAAGEGEIERFQRCKAWGGESNGVYLSDAVRTKGVYELLHVTVTRTLRLIRQK